MDIVRLTQEQRRDIIITAGVRVARTRGIEHVNPITVADECNIKTSSATVRLYFRTTKELRDAVADEDAGVRAASDAAGFKYGS